jgi:uncharacterized protein YcbK (DUF882 family)
MIKYNAGVDPKVLDLKLQKALFFISKASTFDIIATSGLRSPEHNASVGGVPDSAHLKGMALDLACLDDKSRYWIVYWAFMAGVKRVGIATDHVHLDIDYSKMTPCMFFDN